MFDPLESGVEGISETRRGSPASASDCQRRESSGSHLNFRTSAPASRAGSAAKQDITRRIFSRVGSASQSDAESAENSARIFASCFSRRTATPAVSLCFSILASGVRFAAPQAPMCLPAASCTESSGDLLLWDLGVVLGSLEDSCSSFRKVSNCAPPFVRTPTRRRQFIPRRAPTPARPASLPFPKWKLRFRSIVCQQINDKN